MALFKIFKGSDSSKLTDSSVSGYKVPVDGYAYYDTTTKLFYIDAEYPGTNGVTRQPINAKKADIATLALAATKDDNANTIVNYYAHSLGLSGTTLSLKDGSGTVLNSITLPDSGVTDIVWDSTNKKITKTINGSTSDVVTLATLLNSAALTGTPTAPTAAAGTNTTQIATTAFVNVAITSSIPSQLAHTLTIGTYEFDGSADVTIPIYNGTIA